MFTGVYIASQASVVIAGGISVGTFLATIRVFSELSEKFAEGYEDLMKIMSSFVPLRKLTYLLNMETDLLFWKNQNRKRRELSKMARLEVMHDTSSPKKGQRRNSLGDVAEAPTGRPVFKTDLIEIKLRGMCFAYPEAPEGGQVFQNVTLSCPQGKLIAVVGHHGCGKSTLLRLVGHTQFPQEGMIFIPTHLRILHVSQQPMLLGLSAWRNLVFGRPHAIPDRVRKICQQLRMPVTLKLIEKDIKDLEKSDTRKDGDPEEDGEEADEDQPEDDSWQEKLSSTEKAKMHLARALIMNPEVMVLHRPLFHYDPPVAEVIMTCLKEHVENRGFHVSKVDRDRRRPRTVFFTPTSPAQAEQADVVWRAEFQSVEEIPKDQLHKELDGIFKEREDV